jgi:hypothetical protein
MTGVVDAEVEDNPFLAATVAPNHPRVHISLAMAYFLLQGGRVPDQSRRAALDALRQAPLADEPFLLAAVDALARGDNGRADRLLEEARRRNPRLRLARLLLLDRYLREGRIPEAVGEMKALDGLVEGANNVLTAGLAQMVQDPKTAPQMTALLRRQPKLHEAVLENLVASGADEAVVLNVAGPAALSGGSEAWKPALLTRLIGKGALGQAWDVWQKFTGYRQGPDGKGVYDGAFAGLPGPAPFNWDLSATSAGAAERNRNHGLQVEYYGRDNGNLASQLLMLRPGRYRLSLRASGNAAGEGSRLAWTIDCNPGDANLLQIPVTGVGSSPKAFAGIFTVPAQGCPSQWLRLVGITGAVAADQNATISGLSIDAEKGG